MSNYEELGYAEAIALITLRKEQIDNKNNEEATMLYQKFINETYKNNSPQENMKLVSALCSLGAMFSKIAEEQTGENYIKTTAHVMANKENPITDHKA